MEADNDRVIKTWGRFWRKSKSVVHTCFISQSFQLRRPVSSSDVFTGGRDSLIGRAADI